MNIGKHGLWKRQGKEKSVMSTSTMQEDIKETSRNFIELMEERIEALEELKEAEQKLHKQLCKTDLYLIHRLGTVYWYIVTLIIVYSISEIFQILTMCSGKH